MKDFSIGTFNTQGCKTPDKRYSIARDASKYNLSILGLTETHIEEQVIEEITIDKQTYNVYHNGIEGKNKFSGVGILMKDDIDASVQRITDRICTAEIELNDKHSNKLVIIVAYAPTLKVSEDNPRIREDFYDALNKVTKQLSKSKHMLITLGDFNAKTGSGYRDFPDSMGKYGKGKLNNNGKSLLDYAKENELYLTNTTFKHKMCHRSTWTCPQRKGTQNHHDGTIRRNPYRNQIDYILTKTKHKEFVLDSRSYNGFETTSDHKLLKAKFRLEWYKIKRNRPKIIRPNLQKFKDEGKINEYKEKVSQETRTSEKPESTNEKWSYLTEILKKSANEILGKQPRIDHPKVHENLEIRNLSLKQKQLKLDLDSEKKKERKIEIRKERNSILNEIKSLIGRIEEEQMEDDLRSIEEKNGNQKAYDAVKHIKKNKPRKELKVFDEKEKMITSESKKVDIVTQHFKKIFEKPNNTEITQYPPCENCPPYDSQEIAKATKKLKNGKSPGEDEISAELIKYAPEEAHEILAELLNSSIESDDYLQALRSGILTPLQKPPKKDTKRKLNVRPIILLSVIRKVLAICLISRTWERLKSRIPKDQAAYQSGRSTTEQVFCVKTLAEKAITSQKYEIIIMLIDMSQAFDTVNRERLMNHLQTLLEPHEMRAMYILINDVTLKVRIGKETGTEIKTNVGVCQGDCLSALLFIFYLAHVIKPFPDHTAKEDHYKSLLFWSDLDWVIDKDVHKVKVDPKYADDITFIRSHVSEINMIQRTIPEMLKEGDLIENASKREQYHVPSEDSEWKKCKCLGSLLDTEEDINRRKGLTADGMRNLEDIFKSKRLSLKTKVRVFNAYISSVFLYNSELWALTPSLIDKVDSLHRRLLRKALNIKWPRIVTNERLYNQTQVEKWSTTIKRRRLSWLGHLLRLDKETPARIALKEACRKVKRNVGKSKTTWIQVVKNDVRNSTLEVNLNDDETFFEELEVVCKDRTRWKREIRHMML